jgi:uncharacterized cupin superfamily protein
MSDARKSVLAVVAAEVAPRAKATNYPSPFAERVAGRTKRPLGDLFGIKAFGVNFTTLAPGAISAVLHRHHVQDEFIYVLEGEMVLVTDRGEVPLGAGMCAGFPAGGVAHQLVNRSSEPAAYLEIGDRATGETVDYPADDLAAVADGLGWRFTRKDGSPY